MCVDVLMIAPSLDVEGDHETKELYVSLYQKKYRTDR